MKRPLRWFNSAWPHKQLHSTFTGKQVKGPASVSLQSHFIVLLVFIRNQFGMERFLRAFMASLLLITNRLWAGYVANKRHL